MLTNNRVPRNLKKDYTMTQIITRLALLTIIFACSTVHADTSPVGTTFTYQGRLTHQGEPVNGAVTLRFRIFPQEAGGSHLGELVAPGFIIGDDGRFTIDLDFGQGVFDGEPRWLEVQVNDTTLSPRQPFMAAPYAMVATTAANVPTKAVFGNYTGITGVGVLNSLNVNGNVGIGTTSPQDAIHAVGSQPTLRLEHAVGDSYSEIKDGTEQQLRINKVNNQGGVLLDINPKAENGTSNAQIRFFRETSTTGPKLVQFLRGDSSTSESARIGVDGHDSFFQMHGGNLGIGTDAPTQRLDVAGSVIATNSNWAIRGIKTGSGTFPGVWGETASASSGASGVRGYSNAETGGNNSAGVYGHNFANNGSGYGVRGVHDSDGVGVYGVSLGGTGVQGQSSGSGSIGVFGNAATGVRGTGSTFGVQGVATNVDAYGGSFSGSGFLGGGKALIVWGDAHMLGNTGFGTLTPQDRLHVVGTTRTDVLRIMGGSDLSERFDVADADITPIPGMVVCIDPRNPGKLIPSSRAYDRTVAGIISGANGINSGMIMGQEGSEADGKHPVALTGRVYVMVDAASSGVEPGDLLTTSDVPGHAMKVDDYDCARGAIIGKAMTALEPGESGMVLVLVSLQ